MGFLTKAKAAAELAVDKGGEKVGEAVDKGVAATDERTGGKHTDKLDAAGRSAKDRLDGLDGLDGRDDDIANR